MTKPNEDPTLNDHPTPQPTVRPPRPRLARPGLVRETIISVVVIVAVLTLTELAIPRSSLDGPSMQPTLSQGQRLIISRVNYLFGEPQYGDIAVFNSPVNDTDVLIKRVIGLPGDVIEFSDQQVYRNGDLLEEPYFINRPCSPSDCPDRTWRLGEDEYFMMGDNRNRSKDSRAFGPVTRSELVGEAVFRYWPPLEFGFLE
jgi:signal peptidase I